MRKMRLYNDKRLYIILDNWSCHCSETIKAFVDLNPKITLVHLPYSASWMNDIERDFSSIERHVLRNSNFQTVKEAMAAITKYVEKEPSFSRRCT